MTTPVLTMQGKFRIGILATHPIQYHAPLFRELARRPDVDLTVFFCHRPSAKEQGAGFGVAFQWDVDLTSGYRHVWIRNVARRPGVDRFSGCDTPEIAEYIAGRKRESGGQRSEVGGRRAEEGPECGVRSPESREDGERRTEAGSREQGAGSPESGGDRAQRSEVGGQRAGESPESGVRSPESRGDGERRTEAGSREQGAGSTESGEDGGRAFDFFIVHGWAWKSCWQAFFACWRTDTPLGVRSDSQLPQGPLTPAQRLKQLVKWMVYPWFIRRFDFCLPYGQRSAEYFRHYRGRRIAIAPHFVDNDWFAARAAEQRQHRLELRRAWGIPEGAFCFLFCGKFDPIKRPMDLLRALKALDAESQTVRSPESGVEEHTEGEGKGKGPQEGRTTGLQDTGLRTPDSGPPGASRPVVHLLMVGDGELRAECEGYTREHRLPVTFAGFLNQSEMPKAYAASDCLVLCSESETWGLVVNEAMACGLPAIVSRSCGCVPDIIAPDGGRQFPVGAVDDLAARMLDAMLSGRADALAGVARNRIQSFSAMHAADCLLEASRSLGSRGVD